MQDKKSILLLSMPFAETSIPSIQLALLESYLKTREIDVKSKNLYLKAAEIYGLIGYNNLINSPNDSYIAQMSFSKYVFPEHFNKNIDKFRFFYENKMKNEELFSFEEYIAKTDEFYAWAINQDFYKDYDIIGFSLNYGQFLPSISIAKKIKEKYPEKRIVLGGSTTINELGKKILGVFSFIDFIVSGEGEEALNLLAREEYNYKKIPGLIYREKKEIFWNQNKEYIDLNNLSYPDFQSYYEDINSKSAEIKQYFSLFGRLPIELSRGCWWNKCSFCNISSYNKKYREKKIKRFIDELNYLSEKYKMLSFQVIANTLPQADFKRFCQEIINLEKDFDFYIEARAGRLKKDDYTLLKKAGFNTIQTGIETFSKNYIKKMNKGVRVIDNIAALKFCRENEIRNIYNIIINYPNEEKIDFLETKDTTDFLKSYIDPPQISKYLVGYQSPIYNQYKSYNIKDFEAKIIDTIIYPEKILNENFYFFSQFRRKEEIKENNWKELVSNWNKERKERKIEAINQNKLVDKYVFYYIDGKNFIKIYDKRFGQNVMIYILNKVERDIFMACEELISLGELKEKISNITQKELVSILNDMLETKIIFNEDNLYLSLPLNYSKLSNLEKSKKQEQFSFSQRQIINN